MTSSTLGLLYAIFTTIYNCNVFISMLHLYPISILWSSIGSEGEPISMMSSYKYLGYIVDGVDWHGEDKAEAEKRNYWMD